MTGAKILHVSKPSNEQIEEVVQIIVRAFGDDIAIRNMTGDTPALVPVMFRAMVKAGLVDGEVHFAFDHADETRLLGISVWFPPGKEIYSTPEQRKEGFDDFFAALPAKYQEWFKTDYMTYFYKFLADTLGPTTKKDSWYLNVIAVDPSSQHKGVGSELMNFAMGKARANGEIVSLTAAGDSTLRFYSKLGFENKGDGEIPGLAGTFPVHAFMFDTRTQK